MLHTAFYSGKQQRLTMHNNDIEMSITEAKSTLESIAIIEKDTNEVVRPPLWLTLIISCLYGIMTFSWAATRHENLWMLGLIVSTLAFLMAIAFYLHSSRLLGVKPKVLPRSKQELIFHIFSAIFFGMIFVLARILSMSDMWWASYAGGAINAVTLAFLLHRYSTGNFKTDTSQT